VHFDGELALRIAVLSVLVWGARKGRPRGLIVAAAGAMTAAVLAALADAYSHIWWLDDFAHALVVPLVAAGALAAKGFVSAPHDRRTWILATGGTGLALSVVWEGYEWLVPRLLPSTSIATSITDTGTDIGVAVVMSLVVGLVCFAVQNSAHQAD
jgi:hypothetical protein